MAQWCESLPWRRKGEALAWARIEPMCNGVQSTLGVAGPVCPLGQVLAQQPIRVLIGAALPGTMWGHREDANRQVLRQLFRSGHRCPAIIGQGLAQRSRHMPELLDTPTIRTFGIHPFHVREEDQAVQHFDLTLGLREGK